MRASVVPLNGDGIGMKNGNETTCVGIEEAKGNGWMVGGRDEGIRKCTDIEVKVVQA